MKRLAVIVVVAMLLAVGFAPAVAAAQGQAKAPAGAKAPAKPAAAAPAQAAKAADKALLDPKSPEMNKQAPAKFRAKFTTTKGDFVVEVTRDWAPIGADHFYNLVRHGFYDNVAFFRVMPGFMVQFGINGDPKIQAVWADANLKDEPVKQKNTRGMITYAKTMMPNTRSTQLFINYADNSGLDAQGFSPFGQVVEGMDVVDKINSQYGGTPSDDQPRIQKEGNAFLKARFPNLDYIHTAKIVPAAPAAAKSAAPAAAKKK
jgi:peptidyl-prolyl cis-trans isomerase A (cyclophilin A)